MTPTAQRPRRCRLGWHFGGVLGDTWRNSLPVVLAGSGVAIALLAGLSWAVRGFGGVFERAA